MKRIKPAAMSSTHALQEGSAFLIDRKHETAVYYTFLPHRSASSQEALKHNQTGFLIPRLPAIVPARRCHYHKSGRHSAET